MIFRARPAVCIIQFHFHRPGGLAMTKRSVAFVIILTLVTFGIYGLVWFVKTKGEMVEAGADIPTAWLLIVPIANIYWVWKWCGGVEHVTEGRSSQALSFVLVYLLSVVGMAIVQAELNKAIDRRAPHALPVARVA
jgi:Domain of unknown function (DUF4234)